jgi:hypothetical protein
MNLLFPYIRKWNPFSYFIRIYIACIIFNAATLRLVYIIQNFQIEMVIM